MNVGMSEAFVRDLLRQKAIAANTELAARYPKGYALLGVANGKLIYEPSASTVKLTADWDKTRLEIDTKGGVAKLIFASLVFSNERISNLQLNNVAESFPLVENQAMESMFPVPGMRIEFLDIPKRIFVIGFKAEQ